eukprot:COSAG02_NODE_49129_length_329_cov_0.369565_1_plen_55_part_01
MVYLHKGSRVEGLEGWEVGRFIFVFFQPSYLNLNHKNNKTNLKTILKEYLEGELL